MIRVTVPRPVAEALMPRECTECYGKGFSTWTRDDDRGIRHVDSFPCSACGGSTGRSEADWVWGAGSVPPVLRLLVVDDAATIVRAIEAGERIGIDVECETCEGRGHIEADHWDLTDPNNHLGWVPCTCTNGRVPVGSVRPVRVAGPIIHASDFGNFAVANPDGTHRHFIGHGRRYGPAESLVGKFAVEVEDARRGE